MLNFSVAKVANLCQQVYRLAGLVSHRGVLQLPQTTKDKPDEEHIMFGHIDCRNCL